MANTHYPSRRDSRRQRNNAAMAVAALIIGCVVTVLIAVVIAYVFFRDDDTATAKPPSAEQVAQAQVEAARKIKPLEDLKKGDRVLYGGDVCRWQEWDESISINEATISSSIINCPERDDLAVPTARLTPVEHR